MHRWVSLLCWWLFWGVINVWYGCWLKWFKWQTLRSLRRLIIRMQQKTLRHHAAIKAYGYAQEYAWRREVKTLKQLQTIAQEVAQAHISTTSYSHLSPEEAKRCYMATFLTLYLLNQGESLPMMLPRMANVPQIRKG